MKKVGKLLVMLSLVAMAPSYAAKPSKPLAKKTSAAANVKKARPAAGVKKARPVSDAKQSKIVDQSHLFKGLECTIVFVNSNYSGEPQNGEFCTPYTTLDQAAEAAPENAIIYVLAGEYRTNPYESPYDYDYDADISAVVTLKNGQKLIGSGCALRVGEKTVAALTERHPVIFIGFGQSGVVVKNRNYVSGFEFIGEGVRSELNSKKNAEPIANQFGISSFFRNRQVSADPSNTNGTSIIGVAGGSCHISKNSFVNLETAVDVFMAGWSNIEICGNKFVSKIPNDYGVIVGTHDGTTISITKNFFEGVCFDITISGANNTSPFSEKDTAATCSLNMENTNESSSVCMGSEIVVESNIFKKPLIGTTLKAQKSPSVNSRGLLSYALSVQSGAKTASFRHNKVYDFKSPRPLPCPADLSELPNELSVLGILITLGVNDFTTIPGSFADVCHNLFERVDTNVLELLDANATIKDNEFVKCVAAMGIASLGGVTAWVENNRFCDNSCVGFGMEIVSNSSLSPSPYEDTLLNTRVISPSCLLLTDNKIEGHECLGTAYFLANETQCPTLFKVAVQNPLNGRVSLSKANDNGLVIIQDANGDRNDNAVDFVRHCPGCGDSR